jgi:ribosomal protein L24E
MKTVFSTVFSYHDSPLIGLIIFGLCYYIVIIIIITIYYILYFWWILLTRERFDLLYVCQMQPQRLTCLPHLQRSTDKYCIPHSICRISRSLSERPAPTTGRPLTVAGRMKAKLKLIIVLTGLVVWMSGRRGRQDDRRADLRACWYCASPIDRHADLRACWYCAAPIDRLADLRACWYCAASIDRHADMRACWYCAAPIDRRADLRVCWYCAAPIYKRADMRACWYCATPIDKHICALIISSCKQLCVINTENKIVSVRVIHNILAISYLKWTASVV